MVAEHEILDRDIHQAPSANPVIKWRALICRFWIQDLTVKYNRSFLGFAWSLLSPMLMLGVISLAFSFAFDRNEGSSYTLHLLSTLLPWMIFSQAVAEGCQSIVGAERILRQFPVPKLIFPLRRVLFRTSEGLLSFAALFCIALTLNFQVSQALFILPLAILNLFMISLGLASIGAVAVVYFRDLEHLISVAIRAWFYATPIIIPFERIPEAYQPYFRLNPMYYVLELFDAPIARGVWPDEDIILIATGFSVSVCLAGCLLTQMLDKRLIFRI